MTRPRTSRPPAPPAHLSAASAGFWRRTVREYVLAEQHLRTLQAALEAWDRGQEARRLLKAEGIIVRDRFGAPRAHPCIGIERDSRLAWLRAMRELDLEGEPAPGNRRT